MAVIKPDEAGGTAPVQAVQPPPHNGSNSGSSPGIGPSPSIGQTHSVPAGVLDFSDLRAKRQLLVVVSGEEKSGKALALDTPLPTPTGWTTMGDVQVGDVLFDEAGHQCAVEAVTSVMEGHQCYRVRFSDGSSLVADAEHLWSVTDCQYYRPVVLTTGEMAELGTNMGDIARSGIRRRFRLPPVSRLHDIADVELPIDPYVLGVWLSDGSKADATVTCASAEVMARVAESEKVTAYNTTSRAQAYGLGRARNTIRGYLSPEERAKTLKDRLRQLGLLYNKHIPPIYLRGSYSQRVALLQGMMDTDGYIAKDKHSQCEFSTTKAALAAGMRELLCTLGVKSLVKEGRAMLYGKDCGPKFRVMFSAPDDVPVFYLSRKKERQLPPKEHRRRSLHRHITAIEPVESVPVRCITVDSPCHTYLAGETMIPTHNTDWALRSGPGDAYLVILDPNSLETARKVQRETGRKVHYKDFQWGTRIKDEAAVQRWEDIQQFVLWACSQEAGTIVFDTETRLKQLCDYAFVGQNFQMAENIRIARSQLRNDAMTALINVIRGGSLSSVMIERMGEKYVRNEPTGTLENKGWKPLPYEVTTVMRFWFDATTPAPASPFRAYIGLHGPNPDYAGTEWYRGQPPEDDPEGGDMSFARLLELTFGSE